VFPLGGAVYQSCSGSDGSRGRDPDARTWFESGCIVSCASLAHFWQHVRTTVARDSMEAPGVEQLIEDVTRLLKVHSHPHTYVENWKRADRHLSNQWMIENPNVRIDGALTGRAGPSEAPPGVPEKYSKKRIKISTRRLFVPGVPFLVRESTRRTCIHLEKKALLDLL